MADEARLFYPDGNYGIRQAGESLYRDFGREKDLCNYVEEHMNEFCHDILEVGYASHKREYKLSSKNPKRRMGIKKIDFLINTIDGHRIGVECKNPCHLGAEASQAVGQLLGYICLFEMQEIKIDRFILLTTQIDYLVPAIIHKFNLPIEFIAMDKSKFLKLLSRDK